MPPKLVKAHRELDKAVDLCYRPQAFTNETARIEFLFDYGTEYYFPIIEKAKILKRWKKLSADDLNDMSSFSNCSVGSIMMVHISDRLEVPDKSFREVRRIQKKGGYILLSGMFNYNFEKILAFKFKSLFGGHNYREKYERSVNKSRHHYNFYSKKDKEKHKYKLLEYRYFNAEGFYMYVCDFFTLYTRKKRRLSR